MVSRDFPVSTIWPFTESQCLWVKRAAQVHHLHRGGCLLWVIQLHVHLHVKLLFSFLAASSFSWKSWNTDLTFLENCHRVLLSGEEEYKRLLTVNTKHVAATSLPLKGSLLHLYAPFCLCAVLCYHTSIKKRLVQRVWQGERQRSECSTPAVQLANFHIQK